MRRKCGNAEDLKATAQKRIEYAPRPLPERRPRALTVSSIGAGSEKTSSRWSWNPFRNEAPQRTFDQLQSPLIAKLPKELRLLIWKEVVGGHWLLLCAHERDFGPYNVPKTQSVAPTPISMIAGAR